MIRGKNHHNATAGRQHGTAGSEYHEAESAFAQQHAQNSFSITYGSRIGEAGPFVKAVFHPFFYFPLRGWSFDTNSFRQRARNYFDHNAIGNSNLFFPLSIAGARISGLEFTMRSPQLWKRGEASIAYSYQHAEGEGAITGGLTDFSPPAVGYFFLDHDQRHTLHGNFHWTLPKGAWVSGGAYYGSGFTDGSSAVPRHLQGHTTFDAQLGKALGEKVSLGLTALNLTNRRFLLDNSLTFGGTHYGDPRQIYLELKYRFKY